MARKPRYPHRASFTARAGGGRFAARQIEGLRQALLPEAGRSLPGASVHLRRLERGRALEVTIEAETLRSLRAAVNSYLRWTALALDVANRAGPEGEEE
jgi:tRNA threonylcarbamoyladenosine modification (KEOPS) complex  Pcc1 subunit